MAQLSAWQDYTTNKLYIQQISIPLTLRNNVRILPGKTGIVTLTLQPNKTSFTSRHTIMGKGIAYVKPLDHTLPLRPIEIELENNRMWSMYSFTISSSLCWTSYRVLIMAS